MSRKSNDQGRAYEYIFLHSLQDAISQIRKSRISQNSSYTAAKKSWETLSEEDKVTYSLSAQSTIDMIFAMEPNMIEIDDDELNLYIQNDERGEEGDVRDIIVERKDITWEIGLSIKHNHMAVKHSRIAKTLDFGEKWYGIKCSDEYWNEVKPTFEFLEEEKIKGTYFRELSSKEEKIYVPLLNAFMKEIRRHVEQESMVSRRLVEYLLSKYDFYKVVSNDSKRHTTIQTFNMFGTLNKPSKKKKPTIIVPAVKLPTTLLYIGFKPKSKTTVLMSFDNGWQFSIRISTARDKVEPLLKFDIQIDGMPSGLS